MWRNPCVLGLSLKMQGASPERVLAHVWRALLSFDDGQPVSRLLVQKELGLAALAARYEGRFVTRSVRAGEEMALFEATGDTEFVRR